MDNLMGERFRLIDAEGFLYTVKPEAVWIQLSEHGFSQTPE